MAKFEIGEIAIEVETGEEVLIIGIIHGKNIYPNSYLEIGVPKNAIFYETDTHWLTEEYLRKKKPPEELSSWEKIQKKTGWNPVKEKISG